MADGLGADPSLHTGATPLAHVGREPSAQAGFLCGLEPSAQTQVGLVLSPHGLKRGLQIQYNTFKIASKVHIVYLVTTVPLSQVHVGLFPSEH